MIEHQPGEIFVDKKGGKHRLIEGGECCECSLSGTEECGERWCMIFEPPSDPIYFHYERVEE